MSLVSLASTESRAAGLRKALSALDWDAEENPIKGRQVLVKPNWNTADPAPGSTDNETLLILD